MLSSRSPRRSGAHAALATVSRGCSPPKGRLPTRSSPVRRSTRSPKESFALDLHVLGTPPTFVLSQDQTLQFEPQLPSELTSQITHYSVFKEQTARTRRHKSEFSEVPPGCLFLREKASQTSRLRWPQSILGPAADRIVAEGSGGVNQASSKNPGR